MENEQRPARARFENLFVEPVLLPLFELARLSLGQIGLHGEGRARQVQSAFQIERFGHTPQIRGNQKDIHRNTPWKLSADAGGSMLESKCIFSRQRGETTLSAELNLISEATQKAVCVRLNSGGHLQGSSSNFSHTVPAGAPVCKQPVPAPSRTLDPGAHRVPSFTVNTHQISGGFLFHFKEFFTEGAVKVAPAK